MSIAVGDKNTLGENTTYSAVPDYEYSYNITLEVLEYSISFSVFYYGQGWYNYGYKGR